MTTGPDQGEEAAVSDQTSRFQRRVKSWRNSWEFARGTYIKWGLRCNNRRVVFFFFWVTLLYSHKSVENVNLVVSGGVPTNIHNTWLLFIKIKITLV